MNLKELDQRQQLCIFAGCDYLENVKGLGILLINRFFQEKTQKVEIRKRVLKALKTEEAVEEYYQKVALVNLTFNHQIVFNPDAKKDSDCLVHLFGIPKTNHTNDHIKDFCGYKFQNGLNYCSGKQYFDNECKEPVGRQEL